MLELLSEEEINLYNNEIPLWQQKDNSLVRELSAPNFIAAVGMVNAIAIAAEKLDHHPDILIYGWNKIRITTTTHDKGGLTKLDFDLAKKIDEINFIF